MSVTPNVECARLAVGRTTVLLSTSDDKKAKSVLHFLVGSAKMDPTLALSVRSAPCERATQAANWED